MNVRHLVPSGEPPCLLLFMGTLMLARRACGSRFSASDLSKFRILIEP